MSQTPCRRCDLLYVRGVCEGVREGVSHRYAPASKNAILQFSYTNIHGYIVKNGALYTTPPSLYIFSFLPLLLPPSLSSFFPSSISWNNGTYVSSLDIYLQNIFVKYQIVPRIKNPPEDNGKIHGRGGGWGRGKKSERGMGGAKLAS